MYDVFASPPDGEPRATTSSSRSVRSARNRQRPEPTPERSGPSASCAPAALRTWRNFADRWDPVALEQTLRDEFDPPKDFANDQQVNNPARDNHELLGYLSVAIVHDTIVAAAG